MEKLKQLSRANGVSSYVRDGLRSVWLSLETCGQNCKEIAKTAVEELTAGPRRERDQSSLWLERRKSSDSALNVHRFRSRGSRSSEGSMNFNTEILRTSDGMSALLRSDLFSESSFGIKRELLQSVRSGKIKLSGNGGLACQEQGPVGRRATMDSSMRNGKTITASASFTQKPKKKMVHRSSCPIMTVKGNEPSRSTAVSSSTSFNNSNKAKSTVGNEEIADGVVTFFDSCPVKQEFVPSYWIGLSIRKEPTDGSLRLIVRQTGSLPAIVGTKRFSKLTLGIVVKGNKCCRRFDVTLMKSKRDKRFASNTLSLKGMDDALNITIHCTLRLNKNIVRKSVVDDWSVFTKTGRSRFHWKQMKGTSDL